MIDEKTRVIKFILSQKNGFSLIELITAIGLIGVLTLVSLSFFKSTINLQIRNSVDLDLHQLKSEIQDILDNRNHCNANFFSKPIGVNLPIDSGANGLYKCNTPTDNCITAGTPVIRFPVVSSLWEQSLSKISHQVRISDVRYTLSGSTTSCEIQSLDLTINYQSKEANQKIKNLVMNNSISVVIKNGVVKECYTPGQEICPPVAGQISYTTPGTFNWTVPDEVNSVSVVCVGGGGGGSGDGPTGQLIGYSGGGGGGLAYGNNIPVIPGNSYTVVVGTGGTGQPTGSALPATDGTNSSFGTAVIAYGGSNPANVNMGAGGGFYSAYGSGGSGGSTGVGISPYFGTRGGGGGGAGGYGGSGGNGGGPYLGGGAGIGQPGQSGSAGGGGGGAGSGPGYFSPAGGGGVGILGQGVNGAGGSTYPASGYGGSGGDQGDNAGSDSSQGKYGAGGAFMKGGDGACRIIWPGSTRQFPSTGTADM